MSNYIDLVKMLVEIETEEEMTNFLNGLLTLREREEFVRRIEIVKMLKSGISQHDIAKRLGVGVATVTRGSKEIQLGRFNSVE